jgi:hypothetical protein
LKDKQQRKDKTMYRIKFEAKKLRKFERNAVVLNEMLEKLGILFQAKRISGMKKNLYTDNVRDFYIVKEAKTNLINCKEIEALRTSWNNTFRESYNYSGDNYVVYSNKPFLSDMLLFKYGYFG